ncbi:MAG: hypothetical protein GXP31_10900, partial [Kiritimatiellaeota bacterium]|nr:hypothetical protein [Kiritimatiellota bacterium]
VTFVSLTPNVATVNGSTVTVVGAGQARIRAAQDGNARYAPASNVNRTFTVAKVTLTAMADNQVRRYGEPNPTLTMTYLGFVGLDDATVLDTPPSSTTTATQTSPPGKYPIHPAGGHDNSYDFRYVRGELIVEDVIQLFLRRRSWNLLALPFRPAGDTSPARVLVDAEGQPLFVGRVYAWDKNRQSFIVAPGELAPCTGFWTHGANGGTTKVLHGPVEPNVISVAPGWNIVGVAADTPLADVLDASPDVATLVWWWDAASKRYEAVPGGGVLERGRGYWLFFLGTEEAMLQP